MKREEIFEKLEGVFNEVLDMDGVELTEATCADDVEEWDSLAQVQLIFKIEKIFNIKFSAKEMLSWDNVGQMVDTIQSKL